MPSVPTNMSSMPKTVAVAVDDSTTALGALIWAIRNFASSNDGASKLHILTVTPPVSYPVMPTAPIATAGAVAAITQTWENEKMVAEQRAKKTLEQAKETAKQHGLNDEQIATHVLPAAGGASGVAESIVVWSNKHLNDTDILVLGARGMGWKRPLMSLIGLGSVSDYCVHNVHLPVVVYHPTLSADQAINGSQLTQVEQEVMAEVQGEGGEVAHAPRAPRSRHIMLSLDDSAHSQKTLLWALEYLLKPNDQLHLVSVAVPVPFPVLDEASAAVSMMETQNWQDAREATLRDAYDLCQRGVEVAVKHGVPKERIWFRNLLPEGGASDVAQSLVHYAKDNKVDLVVVGSRGMSAAKRAMSAFFGLGSVSDYVVHNCPMSVMIYKSS